MTNSRKSKKSQFGVITEQNVDEYMQMLISDTTGPYIIQSVAFSKTNQHQLRLLRAALLESSPFSGLIKHLLANRYEDTPFPLVLRSPDPYAGQEQDEPLTDKPTNKLAKGSGQRFF